MTTKQTVSRVRASYSAANREAATLIASDPVAYPENSLMAQWADRILTKAAQPDQSEAGPLFSNAA